MTDTRASLIITVLNEASSISGFLDSLRDQTQLPGEIVVVDGGSTDGTAEIIRAWIPPVGVVVRVIESIGAGISKGRNLAISAAKYDRLLITDAGTVVDPDWGRNLLATAAETGADVVSGFFFPVGTTLMQRTIAFAVTPTLEEVDPAHFLPSSRSVSFTRDAWEAVGGYPEWLDYCEDLVFDIAMKDAGLHFAFEPRALVSWSARPSIRAFIKQYYRYARGDGKAHLWSKRHAVRYSAYLFGATLLATGFLIPWIWAVLLICAVAYMSKFWRRLTRRRRYFGSGLLVALLLVPLVVVAGDLAKMLGYPSGLRWRSRKRS
ncbi:glycosyltransferase [Microbacterium sp.]|uniref:glycosyltransferase n=1 Tax=Microbacterium sp. TaxID=51671 RepID=UPI003C718987